ncbi:MAG: zinc-ribbon domain containing protein [Desulfobacterales bacterium]|nr:zinc-ribbon domain containing protein [Desulfobacterales bacterium]
MNKRKFKKVEKENQKRKLDSARAEAYKSRLVPVDKSKLNLGNSYEAPPDCYRDIDFTCVDCGSNETWLAEQQKWWYEEVGGYYFSTAIRCRSCRKKEKERKEEAKRVHLDGIKMKRGK